MVVRRNGYPHPHPEQPKHVSFLLLGLSYVLGATPTSYWVGRGMYGVDLRERGSGNLGATNTFRVLGWKAAVPVVLADVTKGFLPVWLFPQIGGTPMAWTLAFGAAAVLGHMFSFWVGLKGGKGVATSAGVFLGLAPWAVLGGFVVWLLVVLTTRYVAAGSIAAAGSLPVLVWLTPHRGGRGLVVFTVALALFIIAAHRSNIRRLFGGTENRFGREPEGGLGSEGIGPETAGKGNR